MSWKAQQIQMFENLRDLPCWAALQCLNILRYQKDRLITGCRSEGLFGLHSELVGLRIQVLYPAHAFGVSIQSFMLQSLKI